MGAEVVKVESTEGDLMRSRPVQRDGFSTMFGQLNAGKKSIVLDLKKPEAVAAIKKLAATVDILVENYRPGVMKRLGLDYAELSKVNPRLIYCAISGYGQTGPGAGRPAYAPVIHASTGYDMAHLFYQQGRQRPDNCGIFVADYASGAYAMGAILAAVHQRHATGKGQMVDVSMFETLVGMLLGEVNRAQFDFEMPSRPMYGPIEASDGYVMLATASEKTFQDMATAAGRRDWLTDPRFEKYKERRMNWGLLVDELEEWSKKMSVKDVVAALEKQGVPCSPYVTVTEALQDPQVEHRGSLCTIEDGGGTYKSPAPPFRFSGSPLQSGPKVAALGEDTKAVLAQAGLTPSEIEALVK
jgi:crotonobetainyl-CoA:carnitine CoA-transferase CaiB-like acyl-CoA transferase